MRLKISCPVRCGSTGAAPRTEAHRSFEMPDCHTEGRKCRKRVDDEATAVARVSITAIRIRPLLDSTIDADLVRDELVLAPRTRFTSFRTGVCIAERTARERLLHDYRGSSSRLFAAASYPAFQPLWKSASAFSEPKVLPEGS